MSTFGSWVTRHAALLLVFVAALTLAALHQIVDLTSGRLRLGFDPSIDALLPESDEGRAYYEHVRQLFGNDESLMLVLAHDDLFERARLERVIRMTRRIEQLDGVHHVTSLATAIDLESDGADLAARPFLHTLPSDDRGLARLKRKALDNPVYAGNLVSADGRATVLAVYLRDLPERELASRGIDLAVAAVAEEERGDLTVWLTGGLAVKTEHAREMLQELRRTLPLALGVAVLVASLAFRTLRGVLIPGATTAIALIWALGIVAGLGRSLNLVTVIVPTLILVVGFAYAVHVVSEYYDAVARGHRAGESAADAVSRALAGVALPVLLTGVTTAAGLLALCTSSVPAVQQFGAFSTLGVLCTVTVALTFAPALLVLLPEPRAPKSSPRRSALDRLFTSLGHFDLDFRVPILVAGGLLAAGALLGSLAIRTSTNFSDPASQAFRSAQAASQILEGSSGFYVVARSESAGGFTEPADLHSLRALQEWLEAQPEIGGTTSVVDYLMLMNRGFQGKDVALAIPDSRAMVSQLLFFGASDELESYLDMSRHNANIHVRSTLNDSASMEALLTRIDARIDALPEHLSARATGNSVLVTRTLDRIARGQAVSLTLAFAAIFAILSILFTSFRTGFLALIPNALPVVLYFGILGLSGITLNVTTGLIACLVLGIAVDDTLHFLARFNVEAKRLASERRGVVSALRSVGRPVTLTSTALVMGFLVLTTSDYENRSAFGALAATTLALAWLIDVTFTPALASRMRIVSLWDVLTLDLGAEPQRSIPFFAGLRKTQARVAALVTDLQTFPAGHRLMRAGQQGNELYVVIEGELAVSVASPDGTADLGSLRRGDVVGEVSLLDTTHVSDVDALTEVRLLRITRENLDELRRRYPKIGAQLYANLSAILLDRMATPATPSGEAAG